MDQATNQQPDHDLAVQLLEMAITLERSHCPIIANLLHEASKTIVRQRCELFALQAALELTEA